MADRRVQKTKKTIKSALEKALAEKPFEQITVTELCEEADISRITFYTHYDDKYALIDEIFSDMLEWATDQYRSRQKENNSEEDIIKTFCNLLDSIFDLYDEADPIVSVVTSERNSYLHYSFYNYIARSMEAVFLHRSDRLKLKYPIQQVSGFICNGLWGFINESPEGTSLTAREEAKNVLSDILRANIVTEMKSVKCP